MGCELHKSELHTVKISCHARRKVGENISVIFAFMKKKRFVRSKQNTETLKSLSDNS